MTLSVLALGATLALPASAQRLAVTPLDSTGIYGVGGPIGWTIRLAAGEQASPGPYTYVVKENGARVMSAGTLDLTRGPATITTSLASPGMVRVEIRPPQGATQRFGNASTGGDGVVVLAAAADPTRIAPVLPRPGDFDAFWDGKLQALSRVPMNAEVTPKASGMAEVEYATVRLGNVGGAHVHAQVAKPARDGRFPAIVIFQWASPPYPLQKEWVTDRAKEGWLAINVQPHDVPVDMPRSYYDALPQMIKSYHLINNTDRDRSYFLQMYLGDYRALDYLTSRPDWDGRTLVVTGISMGGQQSLVMAGLHPRVTAVVVHVPAGADAHAAAYDRMPGYPFWEVGNPRVAETARYFDVVNFASRIRSPVLASMGFIDAVTPAIGIWTALNQIRGVKEVIPLIDAAHNHQATQQQQSRYAERSETWLRALVRGEPVPPSGGSRGQSP